MPIQMLLLYAVMIGALWFFIFRPQKKQRQKLQTLRDSLAVGDKVVTIGGFIGVITFVGDDEIRIKSGNCDPISFKRTAVASKETTAVETAD